MSYISGQNKAQLYPDNQIQDHLVYLHFTKELPCRDRAAYFKVGGGG